MGGRTLARASRAPPPCFAQPALEEAAVAKAVLVVDDSLDFLDLLEALLGREGYTVIKAATAPTALDIIRKEQPSAVLLDIMMPDRTGVDMLESIRWEPRYRDLPVICMSAVNISGQALEFINRFSLGLLGKGDLKQLVAEVRKVIGPP
jgi:CheY-like chemotaxis protein